LFSLTTKNNKLYSNKKIKGLKSIYSNMEKKIINENQVMEILGKVLEEQVSKVSRQDFSRVQFKIEELQNSLNETVKELRKLQDSIPSGLDTVVNGRIVTLVNNLTNSQKTLIQLKDKVKQHKKRIYSQQQIEGNK
jgi:esterase/lipase